MFDPTQAGPEAEVFEQNWVQLQKWWMRSEVVSGSSENIIRKLWFANIFRIGILLELSFL